MSNLSLFEERKITRITFNPTPIKKEITDIVALDESTCVFINGEYHVTLITTPSEKEELAIGFLFCEGIIDSIRDVKSIEIQRKDIYVNVNKKIDLRKAVAHRTNLITTACNSSSTHLIKPIKMNKISSTLKVKPEIILKKVRELSRKSKIHLRTGGTHAAMLCSTDGEVLAFSEDVGRHNAIDKVIGRMILNERKLSDNLLISSGRQSGEMIQKAVQAKIPIVASITAPLSSGIRLADMTGITLVCFARGKRLQIYSAPHRIM